MRINFFKGLFTFSVAAMLFALSSVNVFSAITGQIDEAAFTILDETENDITAEEELTEPSVGITIGDEATGLIKERLKSAIDDSPFDAIYDPVTGKITTVNKL